MKNLKTIRKRNSSEEGFSMVTAAGFGLVIMMIGLTIMSRSIKDNTISASQKVNNRSLAAAESGVSMYLSLLNKKGGIALPTKSSANWAASGLTAAEIAKTTGWQDIAGNSEKGQYKLVSYVPDGNGKAILRVEGRVNQTGTGADDVSTGKTTVEAIIGVTEGAGESSPRAAAIQINDDPGAAAAAARIAAAAADTVSDVAVVAPSVPNNLIASTANNAAIDANTTASGANNTAAPAAPATVAAASATASAAFATNSAASAVDDARTAANAPSANVAGTAANTAAVTAATAAATATAAASDANTAAATANTAASVSDTTTATTAATAAAAAATTAATAAESANTAAQLFGIVSNTSGSGSGSGSGSDLATATTTVSPVTASATATTKATDAVTAANTAITAPTIANDEIASTANATAAAANTVASAANATTSPTAPATTAAATATQSAISATSSAISAVNDAKAAANVTGANTAGTTANTATVTAAAAAANATVAAAAANTAAAAANTAASTGSTAAAETAATAAGTAATTAATAAASAQTASQMVVAIGATRFPGLWLIDGPNNNTSTNFNQSYNAYGLVTNTPATTLWTSPGKIATQIEVPNSVSHTPPAFAMSKCLLAMPTLNSSFLNNFDLATKIPRNGNVLFPATGDRAGSDGIYRYYASNLNLEGNTTVRFRASAKVIVHLQGDMITKGNILIKPCDGAATCNLNNLVIYGYKPNGQLLIKGTNTVGAFIIAPTYSAGVAGGGNGEGYKGALWAHHWTGASNSNKFVVNQDGNEDQNLSCPYTNPSIQVISQAIVPNS